jgi:predicted RNA-binding protein with PUA-like domain
MKEKRKKVVIKSNPAFGKTNNNLKIGDRTYDRVGKREKETREKREMRREREMRGEREMREVKEK